MASETSQSPPVTGSILYNFNACPHRILLGAAGGLLEEVADSRPRAFADEIAGLETEAGLLFEEILNLTGKACAI